MKIFIPILFLFAGAVALQAQDYGITPVDGPVIKADTVQSKPLFLPRVYSPVTDPRVITNPLSLPEYETKRERQARVARSATQTVIESMKRGMDIIRLQVFKPFLSGAPAGYVRLQASNPMILGREPGKYPYDNPYSPENFPQTVRSEYDFATGTYKLVPIKWEEYQKSMNVRFNAGNINNAPIPQVRLTPGDQIMGR
jgi:hypothetical protein